MRVVGIVNATPDSFFDGGRHASLAHLLAHAHRLIEEGADVLDVGGESTRPGAQAVDEATQWQRVGPLLDALAHSPVPISIDTRSAEVARRALDAGVSIVNDVSGLSDPSMASVVARAGAGLVVGHMRGVPASMQRDVRFHAVLEEVANELAQTVERAMAGGVRRSTIVVDPGVGFGKTSQQSAALVLSGRVMAARTHCPVMMGASRKRFLTAWTDAVDADARLPGSLIAAVLAAHYGASLVRVHDVAATKQALASDLGMRAAYGAEEAAP